MTYTNFIDGEVGTTGLEIAHRLSGRAEFERITLPEEQRKNAHARASALNDADFVILCLPDDAAREAVALIDNDRTRIIDASSAHRVADGWTYGFPEFRDGQREAIRSAARVANPGCYPTGFLALVAPLVTRGLLPADWPYTVNAVSGYSGGGKALIERYEQTDSPAFRAYALGLEHKHLPEMRVQAGLAHDPIFAPSVVPAYRGMLVEVPLPLAAMDAASPAALRDALAEQYEGERLVTVHDDAIPSELLLDRQTAPSDRLDLFVFGSQDGKQARLVAMLDNLGKGASGAAVQCLNLMAGTDELAGLNL